MPRDDYDERQEARRDRYEERAEKARARAESADSAARRTLDGIPMGQPILVGHHSERRHRRDLKRADGAMRRAHEESQKAAHYERKAAGVGRAGISTDDPQAVTKLRAKLAELEAQRDRLKAIGKAWRAEGKPEADDAEAWQRVAERVGLDEREVAFYRRDQAMDPLNRGPVPGYVLTNLGSNIRRVRQRIEREEREASTAEHTQTEHETTAGTVVRVEDPDQNRIRLEFDGKPDADVRASLKRYGFRWSRQNQAWQRHLNNAGRYAADAALRDFARPKADSQEGADDAG